MEHNQKEEIKQDFELIEAAEAKSHYRSYKTRQSRLDRYQEEIEYARYELGKTLVQIRKWLRKKHHVKMSIAAIFNRLRKWREK